MTNYQEQYDEAKRLILNMHNNEGVRAIFNKYELRRLPDVSFNNVGSVLADLRELAAPKKSKAEILAELLYEQERQRNINRTRFARSDWSELREIQRGWWMGLARDVLALQAEGKL